MRQTKIRSALQELFQKTNAPLSANEVLEQLKALKPNKTTIYRALDNLVANNTLEEVYLGDQIKRYESTHLDHHHHLVCTECQSIQDVVVPNKLCNQEKSIAKKTGFTNLTHSLEFFGRCPKCK